MKNLTAVVRTERGGRLSHIVSEYETKKAFKEDLKGNGYIVLAIYTEEQVKEIKSKDVFTVELDNNLVEFYVHQVIELKEEEEEVPTTTNELTLKELVEVYREAKQLADEHNGVWVERYVELKNNIQAGKYHREAKKQSFRFMRTTDNKIVGVRAATKEEARECLFNKYQKKYGYKKPLDTHLQFMFLGVM